MKKSGILPGVTPWRSANAVRRRVASSEDPTPRPPPPRGEGEEDIGAAFALSGRGRLFSPSPLGGGGRGVGSCEDSATGFLRQEQQRRGLQVAQHHVAERDADGPVHDAVVER